MMGLNFAVEYRTVMFVFMTSTSKRLLPFFHVWLFLILFLSCILSFVRFYLCIGILIEIGENLIVHNKAVRGVKFIQDVLLLSASEDGRIILSDPRCATLQQQRIYDFVGHNDIVFKAVPLDDNHFVSWYRYLLAFACFFDIVIAVVALAICIVSYSCCVFIFYLLLKK